MNSEPERSDPKGETPASASTGDADLDRQLAKGVIDFQQGVDKAQVWVSAFLIVAAGFVLFSGVFSVPFQGAEWGEIINNGPLHRVLAAPEANAGAGESPLTVFGLAVNWWLTPNWAPGFRFMSLVFHLANGVLLYLLARRLLGHGLPEPVPMLAGLLFIAHPLAVESVAYGPGRFGPQALFFALLAIVVFPTTATQLRPGRMAASAIFYAAAFDSSAQAAFVPVVVLWLDFLCHGLPGVRLRAWGHGCLVFLFVALVLVSQASLQPIPPLHAESGAAGPLALGDYLHELLRRVLMPHFSSPSGELIGAVRGIWGWGVVACLVISSSILLYLRIAAGLAVFWPLAVGLSVVCVVPYNDLALDRQAYLAGAGLALLLPWVISQAGSPKLRTALGLGAVAIVAGLSVMAYQRVSLWTDPETLWAKAAQSSSNRADAWRYLGEWRLLGSSEQDARGRLAKAEDCFVQALAVKPEDGEVTALLGATLQAQGRYQEAQDALQNALRLRPLEPDILIQLGMLHERIARRGIQDITETAAALGWPAEVSKQIAQSVDSAGWNIELACHLALFYEAEARAGSDLNHLRLAAEYLGRAHQLAPMPYDAQACYAVSLAGLGNLGEAFAAFRALSGPQPKGIAAELLKRYQGILEQAETLDKAADALLLDPEKMVEGFLRRGEALLFKNDWLRASYLFETVLDRDPGNLRAWSHLGYVRACMGNARQFAAEHRDAVAGKPESWTDLAKRSAAAGNWPASEIYLSERIPETDAIAHFAALGEIALTVRREDRADRYFAKAMEVRPDAPESWLTLCDAALAAKDRGRAQRWFAEAERRGAAPEALTVRRARFDTLNSAVAPSEEPGRTVIR